MVVEEGREDSFAFKISRVLRVREDNEAEAPKSLAGRTVRVGPSWIVGEDGKWEIQVDISGLPTEFKNFEGKLAASIAAVKVKRIANSKKNLKLVI